MIWGLLVRFKGLVAGLGLLALSLLTMGRLGATRKELRNTQETVKKQGDMQDAAANTRTDRDGVSDSLRDGDF